MRKDRRVVRRARRRIGPGGSMAAVVLARLALVDEAAFPRDADAALRFGSERVSRASRIDED